MKKAILIVSLLATLPALAAGAETAQLELSAALAAGPQTAADWARIGGLNSELGRDQAALEAYNQAVRLEPTNPEYRLALASAYQNSDQFHTALTHYQALSQKFPELEPAWLGQGYSLAQLGRVEEARQAFARAREVSNDVARVNRLEAGAFINAQNLPIAEEVLQEHIAKSPENPDNYDELAIVYIGSGDLDKAMTALNRSIELDPNDSGTRKVRVMVAMLQDNLAQVLEDANFVIDNLKDQDPDMYEARAMAYYAQEQYGLAIKNMEHRLTLAPEEPDVHQRLGRIYLASGDAQSAKLQAEQALALEPKMLAGLQLRARANYELGNLREAQTDLEQAQKIEPRESDRELLEKINSELGQLP